MQIIAGMNNFLIRWNLDGEKIDSCVFYGQIASAGWKENEN
jgi:hypothetical protein